MRPAELLKYGQSPWLDYMRRHLLTDGELARLRDEGVQGVTSNPSIFEKAFAGSSDYDDVLHSLQDKQSRSADVYETLAVEDIQGAADVLRPVYEESKRADGFASLEVSPRLAHDTDGTLEEARRLWKRLDRDNVMIKVPATKEGIPAIRRLLSEGINVNVTLMFAKSAYDQVVDAYLSGLEKYRDQGGDLGGLASVASIFVSRFDVMVDPMLEEKAKNVSGKERKEILDLVGKVGIANATRIYRAFREVCDGERFRELAEQGALPQRILFASTSTKDPRFSDVMYVEALIGRDTVDTVPPATLDALRDHGTARASLDEGRDDSEKVLQSLERIGISLDEVTDRLLDEGVEKFARSFDQLLSTLDERRGGRGGRPLDRTKLYLPQPIDDEVKETLAEWKEEKQVPRLWARDRTLWTGKDENRWLDWLNIADAELADMDRLGGFAKEVRDRGFTHVAVLGMGGSSLCPDVLSRTFPRQPDGPELRVLDSTDPAQIRAFESELDLSHTLFVVSSKSGSTLEPNLFEAHFFERVASEVGRDEAGKRFVAVTDPGSPLERKAEERGYAHLFHGVPGIGGRYSALSDFGMVPAAAMQLDVCAMLDRAQRMVHACGSSVPADQNPGVVLGVVLGTAALRHGRNKVTFVASPKLARLGAWLEQLLAESTGKQGKGLIPVDGEPLGQPDAYGDDRLFAYLRHESEADGAQDQTVQALAAAGHPVVQLDLADIYDLPQEFFRWEIATAVTGAILDLNPFDQPDVEASKEQARKLTEEYEKTGKMEPETYFFEHGPIGLFADERNRAQLDEAVGSGRSLGAYLKAHLGRLGAGDYLGLLAWVERRQEHEEALQAIRRLVRDRTRAATCVGFGPRFLHSTGQAYKGGPPSGVFLHLVGDDPQDLPVPGRRYSFGVVKQAQARGDFRVLSQRDRRLLGVHLGTDTEAGFQAVLKALREVL
jgi:transaldolase/glucose-6-phosphate isomerase